jgi:tyrosinase
MRRLLLLAAAAITSTICAQSYDYGIDVETIVRRQDPSTRILVGRLPLAPNGSTPLRPELRDMRKDPYAWNLYILAQSMLQYVGQDHPLSWYQIAGKFSCCVLGEVSTG